MCRGCGVIKGDITLLTVGGVVSIELLYFFFSSRRRHTRFDCDWSSDVCSSDLVQGVQEGIYRYKPEKQELEIIRTGIQPYERYQILRGPNFNVSYMSVSLFLVEIGRASCRERV